MRYLKGFNDLFESEDGVEEAPSGPLAFTREDVKNLDSYKSLIDEGFVDITPPRSNPGTFKFSHPNLDGMDIFIHSNGYIRYQNTKNQPMYGRIKMAPAIIPAGYPNARKVDLIYGQPVIEPHDYDIKFDWLKKYTRKKYLKSHGISSKGLLDRENPELFKKQILNTIKRSKKASIAASLRKMFPEVWAEIEKESPDGSNTVMADLGDLGF